MPTGGTNGNRAPTRMLMPNEPGEGVWASTTISSSTMELAMQSRLSSRLTAAISTRACGSASWSWRKLLASGRIAGPSE